MTPDRIVATISIAFCAGVLATAAWYSIWTRLDNRRRHAALVAAELAPYIADVEAAIEQALEIGIDSDHADVVLWECELRADR